MSDILFLKERVKNSILVGESDFREFKSALEGKPSSKKPRLCKKICEDIAEALVAFANTDGGEVMVGVEDDGTISGITHSEEDIDAMLNAHRTHVLDGQKLPVLFSLKIEVDGKDILFFQVDKGTNEVYQLPDGRVVVRRDRRTVPMRVRSLQFEQQEVKSRAYDREYDDRITLADLDLGLIQSLADGYLKGLTVERYLQQLGLGEYTMNGLKLRRAAGLLFARDIQKWHPRCQVRFVRVNGNQLLSGDKYNVISDEFVQGNIHELIIKAWEMLRPYLAYKTELSSSTKFEQKFIYPEDACREAILNAIAHRDYHNSNGIEVHIFNDRMEFKSPGALLSTITVEDLEALDNRHESRNAKIALVLKTSKLMREMGEGMKRIFNLMEEFELQRPRLYSNTVWFVVTLVNKSDFTPIQQEFIKLFHHLNLTKLQKRIVVAGINQKELSPADIYQAMNTNDRDTYDREVTALRKAGVLDSFRTNTEAQNIAKLNSVQKRRIARFKVNIPS
jgi:ATP-dependent DNA helicase RecG